MKKVLFICLAVLIGFAFVSTASAQTSETRDTTSTSSGMNDTNTQTSPGLNDTSTSRGMNETNTSTSPGMNDTNISTTKGKSMEFRGEVTNMDMATRMISVSGKKGDMSFDISNAKMKHDPAVGDKVEVKYMEKDGKMMASKVEIEKAKKTKNTTTSDARE